MKKALRRRIAEWLCKPLMDDIARITSRVDILDKSTSGLVKCLVDVSSELNELRNSMVQHPAAVPPLRSRVARTWTEFKTAAEARQPQEHRS